MAHRHAGPLGQYGGGDPVTWDSHSSSRSVPHRLQQACFRRDDWTCQQCGYVGRQAKGDLHADHIVPRSQGGENTLDNLGTRCVRCHQPKSQAEARAGRRRHLRPRRAHPSDHAGD